MSYGLAGLSDALADAIERAAGYTVRVNARGRHGASGIAWSDGVVLAADHTIERDEDITMSLPDGSEVPATIAGRDPGSDLAVLRVESSLTPAPRAGEPRVGHLVVAVGRPGGSGVGASLGIVSAVGRTWRSRGGARIDGFIRPDLTMYPGFSGGPLVDISGAMIGINTSALGSAALTIPATAAGAIVEQLLAHGRLRRGYLGLTSQPVRLPDAIATTAGQETGLLVIGVEPDSPAELAGAIIGDILVAIDDQPLRDTDDLRSALRAELTGRPATLRLLRGGVARELTVTIGER
jgi:S1-C subfamily serine protease